MAPSTSSSTGNRIANSDGGENSSTSTSSLSVTPHTADPLLAPFLRPTFDPTAYLNSVLPSLAIPTAQQPIIPAKHATLQDLTSQTSSQLAELSAQQARLVDALTGMTDDILRSGSRLAYDVELLRSEAAAFKEVLGGESVRADLGMFVSDPTKQTGHEGQANGDEMVDSEQEKTAEDGTAVAAGPNPEGPAATAAAAAEAAPNTNNETPQTNTTHDPFAPPALSRLRTLHAVRTNLSRVISTFDSALSFPLPPSLLFSSSSSSSFVSVAPPSDPALEAAGQEALAKTRASIMDNFDNAKPGGSADGRGIERAEARLAEVRELCGVWKGTVEEKARAKVVDGWEREVAEARERLGVDREREAERRRRMMTREGAGAGTGSVGGRESRDGRDGSEGGRRVRADSAGGSTGRRSESRDGSTARGERRGILGGLRRLRDEIYLD